MKGHNEHGSFLVLPHPQARNPTRREADKEGSQGWQFKARSVAQRPPPSLRRLLPRFLLSLPLKEEEEAFEQRKCTSYITSVSLLVGLD